MNTPLHIGTLTIPTNQLFLIAGPCVIESEAHALKMARSIAGIARSLDIPYIFKASYDKANRTSISSFRGPGLEAGARILQHVRDDVGVPILTDIHDQHDCDRAAEAADILQIPAFLCRQTDLLIAAARTGKTVNIKKGQFAAPADMRHAVEKVRAARVPHSSRTFGAKDGIEVETEVDPDVILTERGTTFGYHNLVVDMRSLAIMRAFAPVVFDATHSVQLPSANPSADNKLPASSGGQPQFIPLLARAAVAAGVDGIFLEVHDDPAHAKSDGENALHLNKLEQTLEQLLRIHAVIGPNPR